MRITEGIKTLQVTRRLADLRSRHSAAAEQATSGSVVNRPSDDPTKAARLLRMQEASARSKSTMEAISVGRADLELAESSLAEVGSLLMRAKELALGAATGTATAETRANAATELAGLHSQILGLANAKGIRGYLFAGSKTDQAAFSALSVYQGDSYEHRIETGPNSEVAISSSGQLAFTALGGRDVFQDLSDLTTALQTNNLAGIQTSLDRLDAGHEQVVRERARTGVNLARLEQSTAMHENSRHLLEVQKSDLSGSDPSDSLSMLSELEQSLTLSTSVLRQLLQLGDRQL